MEFLFFFLRGQGWAGAFGAASKKTPTAARHLDQDIIDDERAE